VVPNHVEVNQPARSASNLPAAARIDDAADERLAPYRRLRDRDWAAGNPARFVCESALVVERLCARPELAESVLVTPEREAWAASVVPPGVPVLVVPEALIREVAGFRFHRGVMAVGVRPAPESLTMDECVPRRAGHLTLLVCEGITDAENVGLLFRTAAAFGVDAVLLSPTCHDPFYRRALRVAVGHTFAIAWGWAAPWPGALRRLREEWAVQVVGAAVGAGTVPVGAAARAERVAVVVGTEGAGLTDAALAECDAQVRVPMAPGVDSLNVGVAVGVLLDRLGHGERT
jgi:tRNA G18 (ribose-2'-O)-methylase SpoU